MGLVVIICTAAVFRKNSFIYETTISVCEGLTYTRTPSKMNSERQRRKHGIYENGDAHEDTKTHLWIGVRKFCNFS